MFSWCQYGHLRKSVFGEGKHQAGIWVGSGSPRRSPYSQSLPRRSEATGWGQGEISQAESPLHGVDT